MENITTLKLTATEAEHLKDALQFFLEEFSDYMDEDHPQYEMFRTIDAIQTRLG